MKIETLTVRNFRCFGPEPETFSPDTGVTAMIGGNGAGKTAALQALARIFGVSSSQRQVQARDFRLRPDETELVSGATRSIECVLSFPELDGLDEDTAADAVPDCFNHMAATAPGETLKARIRLQATWTDDGTPDGTAEEDIRWISRGNPFAWAAILHIVPLSGDRGQAPDDHGTGLRPDRTPTATPDAVSVLAVRSHCRSDCFRVALNIANRSD